MSVTGLAGRTGRRGDAHFFANQDPRFRELNRPLGPHPVVDFALRVLLRPSVALLEATDQLLRVALDSGNVIVGQLAPLLTYAALELCPLALQRVLVHRSLLCAL